LNSKAYLERINYHGPLAPTAETLRALQVAHLLSVPFENLSIHAAEPIFLADEALFTKIVERRRGGFCYECNGLFAALLRALGFDVQMLSAEVANAEGGFSQPFDHMTLLVSLAERWLVDVGFGDSFLEPLRLDETAEQSQGTRAYRIVPDGDYFVIMQRSANRGDREAGEGGEWQAQYRFTLQPHQYDDYAEMCRYHQTSPLSHFTLGRLCSLATETGRITLSEMRFITTSNSGEKQERALTTTAEFAAMLHERFGIVMTSHFQSPTLGGAKND
jgi:N-hydroxyarylamine O-acetyltransferase